MFELRALTPQQIHLRQRIVDERLLLRHVKTGCRTQFAAGRGERERATLQRDGARQHIELDIDRAQIEIAVARWAARTKRVFSKSAAICSAKARAPCTTL